MVDNPLIPSSVSINPLVPGSVPEQAAPVPTEPVAMIGADNKLYTVPPTSYGIAIKSGWRDATPQEINKEQEVQKLVDDEENNKFRAVMDRGINHELLGAPELYKDLQLPPAERAIHEEARQRWDTAHPILANLGKGLGEVADPLNWVGLGGGGKVGSAIAKEGLELAGKEVVEQGAEKTVQQIGTDLAQQGVKTAAQKSLTAKVATNAAKYAAFGAAYSAPNAALQWAYGDKETAAEQMLWGVGLSGVLGAGTELLGAGAKATAQAAGDILARFKNAPAKLEELLASAESKAVTPELKKLMPTADGVANDINQTVQTKMPEIFTSTNKDQQEFLDKVITKIQDVGTEPNLTKLAEARQAIVKMTEKFKADTPEYAIGNLADKAIDAHLDAGLKGLEDQGVLEPQAVADYASNKSIISILDNISLSPEKALAKMGRQAIMASAASLGWHVGGPLGSTAAHYAVGKFLSNEVVNSAAAYLKRAVRDPAQLPIIGSLLAKEGHTAFQAHMSNMADYLSGARLIPHATTGIVQSLLGPQVGHSTEKQYNDLVDAIKRASADTQLTSQKVGAVASLFATHFDLATLIAHKQFNALSYLQSQIPVNPNGPKPFQKNNWKPTAQQQKDFLNKAEIVNNPMLVLQKYQAGTVTPADRDTLKAVYPSTYNEMVHNIIQSAYDPRNKPLSYDKAMKLSMFTGMDLAPGLKNLGAIQQAVQAVPPPPAAPSKQPRQRASRAPKFDKAPTLLTQTGRNTYDVKER